MKTPTTRVVIPTGSETILLVDDETSILELGSLMLQRYGYQVLAAEDGLKALEVYRNRAAEIDLVILDLGMPKMSGQRCLNELPQNQSRSQGCGGQWVFLAWTG